MNHAEREINTVWHSHTKVGPEFGKRSSPVGPNREQSSSDPHTTHAPGQRCTITCQTCLNRVCAPQEINQRHLCGMAGRGSA